MFNTGFSEINANRIYYKGEVPWYVEIALTGDCNFNCKYCNRFKADVTKDKLVSYLNTFDKCKHIQLTGGEPTIHKDFIDIASLCTSKSAMVGLSTNGTYGVENYLKTDIGMFSISLDDYDLRVLEGRGYVKPREIINTIRELSKHRYVNIGMIIDSKNIDRIESIIDYVLNLGVSDIKLSTNTHDDKIPRIINKYPDYPILNYRVESFREGRQMRGFPVEKCYIARNDITIVGNHHYPCLVYFREGGDPIGDLSGNIYKKRCNWVENHNALIDPICKKYCMDFKCEFNAKYFELFEFNKN